MIDRKFLGIVGRQRVLAPKQKSNEKPNARPH
jgi:hypothetical protein